MIKQIFALFRGAASEAAQSFTDQHGLTILRQQIKDSAAAVDAARKAVAVAEAQNRQEKLQYEQIGDRITDLEERTVIALQKGQEGAAKEAAEMIAFLETERDTSKTALDQFQSAIENLRTQLRTAEKRLRDLKRGHRLADATDKSQKMREAQAANPSSALNDAEETLRRLQERQQQIDFTQNAIDELDQNGNAERMIERLAEAGCGTPLKTTKDDVLQRLRKKIPSPKSQ